MSGVSLAESFRSRSLFRRLALFTTITRDILKYSVFLALKKTNGSIKPKGKPKILKNLINGYDIFMLAQRLLHLEMSPELGLDNKKVGVLNLKDPMFYF